MQKPKNKDQDQLRRSQSECSNTNADQFMISGSSAAGGDSDVETVRCTCCNVSEECTGDYIRRIRAAYCGDWVCGLCGEAVSERMRRDPGGVEEALRWHMAVCREFNSNIRLNPKLYLAGSMRDIARRSFRRRTSPATCFDEVRGASKTMSRALSCQPKFFA